MRRRRPTFDFTCLPALLAGMVASWAQADEPFPFPAPPVRAHSSLYLTPDPLPDVPPSSTGQPAPAASKHVTRTAGARASETTEGATTSRGGLVPPARKSIVADTAETDRRIERLQRLLDQLNEVLSRPPVEPPVIEKMITRPIASEPAEPPRVIPQPRMTEPRVTEPRVSEQRIPDPPPVRSHQAPEKPEPPAIVPKADAKTESGKLSANGLIKGLPVAAIDRVHVADNLFAAGEYVLANEIYEQVDRRSISSDESGWVEFQLANCSRRLGRMDDARKRYRRVVADPTLGWLQDMAKWRLDAIDERDQLVKEHARLDAAIKQISEAPRAVAKP